MTFRSWISTSLFCLVTMTAHAMPGIPRDDDPTTVTVGVPKSEIALEPIRYVPAFPTEFGVSVTSWFPRNFARSSYTGAMSSFESSNIPAISILRYSELARLRGGFRLSSKLGIGYLGMERSATPTVGNASEGSLTENLNLFMGRLELELSMPELLPWGLEPNLSAGILPSYALAQNSVYEDSVGVFGVPAAASLGILWRSPAKLDANHGDFSFGLSYQLISGSVGGSSMNGSGVEGELRISL